MFTYVPLIAGGPSEIEAVRQYFIDNPEGTCSISMPTAVHLVNEFGTPWLLTSAFPHIFPYGNGDPTNPLS